MDSSAIKATKPYVFQYSDQALQCFESRRKKILAILNKKSCPEDGWKEEEIEVFLHEIAMMDSNNFLGGCGVGERESRFASAIVARRHFHMGHGVGRSGDVTEVQPKAAGSSLIARLADSLLLDLLKALGLKTLRKCMTVPLATGMSMLLCLRTLHSLRPDSKYVLWFRLDQKSCFKCILASGLKAVVVRNERVTDSLIGSLKELEHHIQQLGADKITCVLSTISSFAPKVPDNVVRIGCLCRQYDIPHLVNNAYGIQVPAYLELIEEASKTRVDLVVSSTDKNFMVPVGGSIIYGYDENLIEKVGKTYPGRGSAAPSVDVFITLLNLGKKGYKNLLQNREDMFHYLKTELEKVTSQFGGRLLETPGNHLSLAYSLDQFQSLHSKFFTEIGSMLFSKFVMGARLVAEGDDKCIGVHKFSNWGSHSDEKSVGYLTASAALGVSKEDIDTFVKHLKIVLAKASKHASLNELYTNLG